MVGGRRPVSTATRAQSNVVGVAILVGITMVALGTMAAAVGGVVDDAATDADVRRVTADFDRVFRPVETTGHHRARIRFGDGRLSTVPRTVRLLDPDGVVETHDASAVVYATGDATQGGLAARRVTFLAGAILVTQADDTRVVRPPPVASGTGVLVVGIPVVEGDVAVGGSRLDLAVETRVTHARRTAGNNTWRIAVETSTPDAWNETLRTSGGTPLPSRDFDGDGTQSVVVRFPGQRTAHVVVHRLQMEVEA